MAEIAFVKDEDVWVMASDGSNAKDLTPFPGPQAGPTWSPDGSQLAYDAGGGIWTVDRDGSNPHLVPNTKGGVEASWSPDGKTIVFTSPGRGWTLYTVSSTGADLRLPTRPPPASRGDDQDPAWSPDGRHILFTAIREASPQGLTVQPSGPSGGLPRTYSLYAAPPEGSNLQRSGQRARLMTLYRPSYAVFWIRPDGTGLQKLTSGAHAAWSPDSRQVAIATRNGIEIVNVSTHRSTRYANRVRGCSEPSWG
jgi:Tol biopolymer transport system component